MTGNILSFNRAKLEDEEEGEEEEMEEQNFMCVCVCVCGSIKNPSSVSWRHIVHYMGIYMHGEKHGNKLARNKSLLVCFGMYHICIIYS